MKKLITLLFGLLFTITAYSQNGYSSVFLRVTDSATFVNSANTTSKHAANYADIWYSVNSGLFWEWNAATSTYVIMGSRSGGGGATAAGATGNIQYKSAGGGLQAEAAFSYDSATNIVDADIITVNDDAYNATTWNGSLQVPTKNAIRDKFESLIGLEQLATIRTETATHDLDATDLASITAGDRLVIHMNSASALNIELPLNSSVAFAVGTIIEWYQEGAGQITFVPLSTVVMRSPANANKSYTQYSSGFIRKVATDTWVLGGDITP